MDKNLQDLLKKSNQNIDEWINMMLDLQTAHAIDEDEGEQISKGKNPLEKSDDEKEAVAVEPAAAPAAVPGETPGANIAIGKKDIDKDIATGEKPSEIKVGAKADKLEKKPRTKEQPNSEFGNIDAIG